MESPGGTGEPQAMWKIVEVRQLELVFEAPDPEEVARPRDPQVDPMVRFRADTEHG